MDGVDANTKVEIYQSIIIRHIVTDLCLHTDNDKNVIPPKMEVEIKVGMPPEMDDGINVGIPIMDDEINVDHEKKKMIKVLSDYMMYILLKKEINACRFSKPCYKRLQFLSLYRVPVVQALGFLI
jgi:hypothetical protein